MKQPAKARPFPLRKALAMLGLLLAFFGILAWTMISGKGHTILVDNKAVDGLEPARFVAVTLDGRQTLELGRGERDKFEVQGQRHRVSVDLQNGAAPIEKSFALPHGQQMVLLSLPKLLAGVEPFFEAFVVAVEPRSAEELEPQESFTSPDVPTVPENFLDPTAPVPAP